MKKKRFRIPIIGLICRTLLGTIAAVNGRKITATYGGITIYLNGQKQVATDVNGKVVEPLIYQGTTYVPIRAVSEWLGKTVTWQGSTSSVLINDSVFSDSDVSSAKNVISEFFTLFGNTAVSEDGIRCVPATSFGDLTASTAYSV
ncbi:MAG: stalk domain-containing protein [Butyricicoccaceae bacterium]